MTIAGLVGGLGPESTIDYYRRILDAWAQVAPSSSPSLVIDSLDVQRGLKLAGSDHAALADYLVASVQRLACAGVDFVAITANTPHLVFDEVARRATVPLLSIVEACAAEAQRLGAKRLALLGTRFTMEAKFYPDVFARHGLTIVIPHEDERAWVHERYVGELLKGDFRESTREGFLSLVRRMRDEDHVEALILGGTELPLLLKSSQVEGLPTLDTTGLHVAAIVDRLRGG